MSNFNEYPFAAFKVKSTTSCTHQQLDDAVSSFLKGGGTIKRIEPVDLHPDSKSFLACRTQAPPHQFNLHPLA